MTKKTNGSFVMLGHELMDSPAWRTASLGARCVVLAIWRRHTGKNNGKISYSRREARADLGCGPNQAVRYLEEAQERGLIDATKRGSFDWKSGARAARATTWRLTMERFNGRDPTNEWTSWTPPENSFDGYRSDTRTGTGAVHLDGQRVPERYPSTPANGYQSDTTLNIRSYQDEVLPTPPAPPSAPPSPPPTSAPAKRPWRKPTYTELWLGKSRCP